MASKGKDKLKKKQFKVEGKVIDLERFAYDIFVHSAVKFGVPEKCICRWEGVENDYGRPDFIIVLSRFMFRCQVAHRNDWYTEFKRYYESTKFKSFDQLRSSLQRIFYDKARYHLLLYEVIISLALISELIIFLYTNNCHLYLMDLVKFWCSYWLNKKKDIEKAGGLAGFYEHFNNPGEDKVDLFFNEFIPAHCIPYRGSSNLQDVYDKEFHKFFNLSKESMAMIGKKIREQAVDQNPFANQLLLQYNLASGISEGSEASGIDVPINPALGIQTHEDLLRNVYGTDTTTSPPDPPITSRQRTARDRKGSYSQRKKASSHSSMEVLERLNPGILGADAASTPQNLPSTSRQETERGRRGAGATAVRQNLPSTSRQETERERRGLSSQKKSLRSGVDMEQFYSHFSGAGAAATLSQDPPKTGYVTLKERRGLPSQNVRQEKKTSTRSGVEIHERLSTSFLRADAAATPQNLPSTSRQETKRKHGGLGSQKERQEKETSAHSSMEVFERLNPGLLGADAAATPLNIPCTSRQETEQERRGTSATAVPQILLRTSRQETERRGSSSQEEEQKKSSSCLSVKELENLNLGSAKKPSDKKNK